MRVVFFAAVWAALSCLGQAQAQSGALRVGYIADSPHPCAVIQASAPAAMRAYGEHLEGRLAAEIQFCGYETAAEASAALAAGQVDFAPVDRTASAELRRVIRPILAAREGDGPGRVLTTVAVLRGSRLQQLPELRGARVVFGGDTVYALERTRLALLHNGLDPASFAAQIVAANADEALATLRAGRADAMVLYAAARQRLCRGDSPSEQPCADVREIWRGRPGVRRALAVRHDMPAERRLRLIGVHGALHLENAEAFSWIAPDAAELQPVEADAVFIAP